VGPTDEQRRQVSVAAARLSNQRTWFRELAIVPDCLVLEEGVGEISPAYLGRFSQSAGLSIATTTRLLFVSFGFFRRRPVVRTVLLDDIESGTLDTVLRVPRLVLKLRNGKALRLEGTRPDREQFGAFLDSLEAMAAGRFKLLPR
jgi:hypothetical protein